MNQKQLQLNFMEPTVHADGANIFITSEGDIPTLNFMQIRREDADNVFADVVASVRLTSLAQLEDLGKTITETIEQHRNQER